MPSRELPVRPDLDHLRNEAKALKGAFQRGEARAVERVSNALGGRSTLKLTEAQRVIAREYGFRNWPELRAHVQAARGTAEAVQAFLVAVVNRDTAGMDAILRAHPHIERESLHVAAVLGSVENVRRRVAEDPARVHARTGPGNGTPLLWLCYSPFHGESAERDEDMIAATRALLDAGADPNTAEERYGVSALYGVCGMNNAPRIARILLEAGANPTDGESVFHAAEHYHIEALELLREYGVQLNVVGEWGNTPLYFLLRYWKVAEMPRVRQGIEWLLEHGADPNVRCGRAQETSLHVSAWRGQHPDVVMLLLERGADVDARRGDGRTAWMLARRGGFDALATLLEAHGASPDPLSAVDALLAACGHGDAEEARALAKPRTIAALEEEDLRLLPRAAAENRTAVALACLAAGFPVDTADETGATALHHAAIHGNATLVRGLLSRGSDFEIRDREHTSPALGWACFGADHVADAAGDYAAAVRLLLEAGARPGADMYTPSHEAVRAELSRLEG